MTRIIIRAVPDRLKCVSYLLRHLPDAEVLVDPDYADKNLTGWEKSGKQFLRAMRQAGDHACIHMEDDLILTVDFRRKVEAAIAERPDTIIQFFSMRSADLTIGSRMDRHFVSNLCVYHPSTYSRLLAEFFPVWEKQNPEDRWGYDTMMRYWLNSRKEPYWIHCPSLVDHETGVSMIDRRRSSARRSRTFRDPLQ